MYFYKNINDFYIKRLVKKFDINDLVEKANGILSKLNKENALNIDEYNEKVSKEYIKHTILVLNDGIILEKEYVDKIVFLLQVSKKIGFHIIVVTKNKSNLDVIFENYFEVQLYFKDSVSLDVSKSLTVYECFLTFKGEIERMTPVSFTKEEVDEFKNCY